MMFYTMQTIYFLKAGDTHYSITHRPLTYRPHRPTTPTKPTKPTKKPTQMPIFPLYDVQHFTNLYKHPAFSSSLPSRVARAQQQRSPLSLSLFMKLFYDLLVPGVLIMGEEMAAPRRGDVGRPRLLGHRRQGLPQQEEKPKKT